MIYLAAAPLLLALAAATATAASAAEPTIDAYLANRDRAIAQLSRLDPATSDSRPSDAAIARLQPQLQRLIPPLQAKGFRPAGSNIETLFHDLGFGKLDGLVFTATAPDTRVVVTNRALLERWLAARTADGATAEPLPQTIAAALRSEAFYTEAILSDATYAVFATLPIETPAGDEEAYAALAMGRQDYGDAAPDLLIGGAIRGDRIFLFEQKVAAPVGEPPACARLWRAAETRAAALKDVDAAEKVRSAGDAARRRCFDDRFRAETAFTPVKAQVQSLVDVLK